MKGSRGAPCEASGTAVRPASNSIALAFTTPPRLTALRRARPYCKMQSPTSARARLAGAGAGTSPASTPRQATRPRDAIRPAVFGLTLVIANAVWRPQPGGHGGPRGEATSDSGRSRRRFIQTTGRVAAGCQSAAMVNPTVTWIRAWSGRPGQSPTRGSHGSGRARLTHPALQIMGSLHDAASLSVGVALR